MPRRQKDPAADVISYFRTTEYAVAKTVLALADEALRERAPKAGTPAATPRRRKPATDGPGTVSQVGG